LTFHTAELLADPCGRFIQHQVKEKDAGFEVTERLAKVVDEAVEDFFVRSG